MTLCASPCCPTTLLGRRPPVKPLNSMPWFDFVEFRPGHVHLSCRSLARSFSKIRSRRSSIPMGSLGIEPWQPRSPPSPHHQQRTIPKQRKNQGEPISLPIRFPIRLPKRLAIRLPIRLSIRCTVRLSTKRSTRFSIKFSKSISINFQEGLQ